MENWSCKDWNHREKSKWSIVDFSISIYFATRYTHLCEVSRDSTHTPFFFFLFSSFQRSLNKLEAPLTSHTVAAMNCICKMSAATPFLKLTSPAAKWRRTEKVEIIIEMMLVHKQAYSLISIAGGSAGWFMLVLLMPWGNAIGQL